MESDFGKAFAISAGVVSAMSVASLLGVANEGLYFIWFAALAVDGFIAIASIIVAIFGRGSIAAGMASGFGVGALVLFATCFANLSTVSLE